MLDPAKLAPEPVPGPALETDPWPELPVRAAAPAAPAGRLLEDLARSARLTREQAAV